MWEELMVVKADAINEKDKTIGKIFLSRVLGIYDILIISDKKRWLKKVKKILAKEGYEVEILNKSIFYGLPAILVDSFSTLRDANKSYDFIKKIIKGGKK